MTSHELAKELLKLPNLPVGLMVNGNSYSSFRDRTSHGPVQIGKGLLGYKNHEHIVIGDMLDYAKEKDCRQVNEIIFSEV